MDNIINKFISDYYQSINNIYYNILGKNNQIEIDTFIQNIFNELKNAYLIFLDKNYPLDELNDYLFYIVNEEIKKRKIIKSETYSYVCPGCLFLGKEKILNNSTIFNCDSCFAAFRSAKDPQWIKFFETFKIHNKSGYACPDCKKFIPKSLNDSQEIICPYLNCYFFGSLPLQGMHHPTNKNNNIYILYSKNNKFYKNYSLNYNIISENNSLIIKVIDDIILNFSFKKQNLSTKHKVYACNAIKNLLLIHPHKMNNYLINNSRSGGFQHLIFQEYVSLIEKSLPLFYQKNKKSFKINSLLDEDLGIFDGISVFEGIVNDKCIIKNETRETYIGGRKSSYIKPYYIGKVLNILTVDGNIPLNNNIINYSFSQIKMKDVSAGTKVIVKHLRIPPHYQMGGMTYINRIRKNIIEQYKIVINNV